MSLYSVCRNVLKVTDEEIAEAEKIAHGQLDYLSPLKMATTARQHALGKHNMAVLTKLRELRDTIKAGASIRRVGGGVKTP